MRAYVVLLSLAACLCASCASVPPEAEALSAQLGRDLGRLHAAHTSLVRQHFGALRSRAEAFVGDVYRPYILRTTMEDLDLVEQIRAAARGDGDLDALDIMEIYADEALSQIETFRRSVLAPINAQEEAVLAEVDSTYGALRNANSVITAHLGSIRRVRDARRDALAELGAPEDFEERLATDLASFSNRIDELLLDARDAEEALDELPDRLRELGEQL